MLKNTSIKSVLITISALLFLASSLFVIMLWSGFSQIEKTITEQEKHEHVLLVFKDTRFHVVQIQQFLTDVGATRNEAGFSEAKENLDSALRNLSTIVSIIPELSTETERLSEKILAMHQSGVIMAREYINNGVEAGNIIMTKPITGLDDAAERLSNHLDKLSDQLNNELDHSNQALKDSIKFSRNTRIAYAIVLMVFVIISLILIYLKVEPPLSQLNKSLTEINNGGGDLTRRLPHESKDEVGVIISRFNDFLSLMEGLMRQVAMETDRLTASSDQLNEMAMKAREDMLEQQMGTDQVATTVTELSATVQEVAINTQSASEVASSSNVEASNGKAVVDKTVQSIHTLSDGIDTASNVIAKVEDDCKNVSSVLDVIQSIADQTNLLALNAAIEAARAGEQGRGFAVVADEVRTLASRTQDSTQEIQNMIEQLQRGSREAVKVMADSQNQAKETVVEIEETGRVLEKISGMVANISGMNSHISSAVGEQQTVVEHINQNVITINNISASTTADTEKTAEEADRLQGIAKSLQSSISQFKL